MIRPTDAEIATAKKEAASKGLDLYLFEYPDPDVDACALVVGMDAKSFAAFWDAATRSSDDARDRAYADHVVWPAAAEADALAESIPSLSALVAKDLCELVGKVDTVSPVEFRLTAETPRAALDRAGISREKADALIAGGERLTVVHFPALDMSREGKGFAVAMKVPSRPVYRARWAEYTEARAALSGILDAACAAVRDAVVWTTDGELPDAIFARYPGAVATDLIYTLQRIGGGTAKGERRRL